MRCRVDCHSCVARWTAIHALQGGLPFMRCTVDCHSCVAGWTAIHALHGGLPFMRCTVDCHSCVARWTAIHALHGGLPFMRCTVDCHPCVARWTAIHALHDGLPFMRCTVAAIHALHGGLPFMRCTVDCHSLPLIFPTSCSAASRTARIRLSCQHSSSALFVHPCLRQHHAEERSTSLLLHAPRSSRHPANRTCRMRQQGTAWRWCGGSGCV